MWQGVPSTDSAYPIGATSQCFGARWRDKRDVHLLSPKTGWYVNQLLISGSLTLYIKRKKWVKEDKG